MARKQGAFHRRVQQLQHQMLFEALASHRTQEEAFRSLGLPRSTFSKLLREARAKAKAPLSKSQQHPLTHAILLDAISKLTVVRPCWTEEEISAAVPYAIAWVTRSEDVTGFLKQFAVVGSCLI